MAGEYIKAFLVGGALCTAAQLLIDFTKMTPARILVLYVTSGVALTALGLYSPLVKFAGAGATVPLTGFGYSLAKGVEKAVDKTGLIGAITGGLTAASGGITAVVVLALLAALIFKGKPK
ncbi:MAG: stage V sporulation protein AE [Clostridia bacterium]|nr:stage V sporulation protein AE [Clostridia bacterium]